MERSEPSLIPEWLKGAPAGGSMAAQLGVYQDDAGSVLVPRHRLTQQSNTCAGNHAEYDSPRNSTSSDRVFSSSRRGHSGNSSLIERGGSERENFSIGRSHSSLTRSSSHRSHDTTERERDGYRGDNSRIERDWEWDSDRDFRSRERDKLLGFASDDRERERERLENGMLRLSATGATGFTGKYDSDSKLKRSQSMGLAPRISESGIRKVNEGLPLASSIQKAAFERNFPSLGAEEKLGALLSSPGNAAISSPRPLWQGPSRVDLSRASSPGLPGGLSGPLSSAPVLGGGLGSIDIWSSALVAEAPSSNGSVPGSSSTTSIHLVSSSGPMSAVSTVPVPAAPVTALNMAEALTQNPPRVRTPPQSSVETQRLEELALKQSRQLIPVTPTLPKTMSLADKNKSKSLRPADSGVKIPIRSSQLTSSIQMNSSHRPLIPGRPDTPKTPQGKLLFRKSNKDGVTVSATPKTDRSNGSQISSHGVANANTQVTNAMGTGSQGQCRNLQDRRQPGASASDAPAGVRLKDIAEDKRISVQAQNRSDFFNALRKKAATNGNASLSANKADSSIQTKADSVSISCGTETVIHDEATADLCHGSDVKENGRTQAALSSQISTVIHSNGDLNHNPVNGPMMNETVGSSKGSSDGECSQEISTGVPLPADSEEEEAAFMRSLGWEENAEGSELTEEEINAFYQMRERTKLLNSTGLQRFGSFRGGRVGSFGSMSSGLSSSDSESDDELNV